MSTSEARILANRENSKKSTGPRTPAGKARSRCNALKHGLTGAGVALPTEDQDEITRSFTAMQEELRPSNELSEKLLRRVAFLFVRVERCERHETRQTAMRVRHAVEKFDDDRLTEVERLRAMIYSDPATSVRRLQMTLEGVNWLLDQWETIGGDLNNLERDCWSGNHSLRFTALMKGEPGGYRMDRIKALSDAVGGSFHYLDKADGEGLEGPARADWARAELNRMMESEVARLQGVRARFDPGVIAIDRAEAVDRALFDPSKEAILARKYEAAAERDLHRTLTEFRLVEAEAAEGIVSNVTVADYETCEPLALNGNEAQAEAIGEGSEPGPAAPTVQPTILPMLDRSKEGAIEAGPASDPPA